MPRKAKKTAEEPPFEEALTALERIVHELERGDLPLERALELFEEGVRLSRFCSTKLDEAEKKIEILIKGADGEWRREPLGARDEEAGEEGDPGQE